MDNYEIVGYTASLFSMCSLMPQVIKTFRTGSATDVSIMSQLFFLTAAVLWIIYGLHIQKMPVVLPNFVMGLSALTLIFMKIQSRGTNTPSAKYPF